VHEPPDAFLRVHAFQRPINTDPAERIPRVNDHGKRPCACPTSPWCRGRDSADWLACSASCAACAPSAWRPPMRTPVDADPVNTRAGDDA
jgi:hypothetical protein